MVDFFIVSTKETKNGVVTIYPKFKIIGQSNDLMIRGGDFYAIWLDDIGLWSTNEQDVLNLIDYELKKFANQYRENNPNIPINVLYMWDAESGMIDKWHKYCQKQCRDMYHTLDENLVFSNTETNKTTYASKRLNYPLTPGECPSYDMLMSTLYSEEDRLKIEWAIGAIVSGDSKFIQKFVVLYGSAGTGKSTVLNIVQQLFEGYYSVFDARALGSISNVFALEAFRSNPLVAIQHDGDLSHIEDNTRLNSLVSHEYMTVNEKFKSTYTNQFKTFLFMGTNKPVRITDAKSGLIRRLIDVSPSGEKLDFDEYQHAMSQIKFELGAIACHCLDVYLDNKHRYDDYIPTRMLGASNDFYNYVINSYHIFKQENGTTLTTAWELYKRYCEEAKVPYPMSKRNFKEELKNYFWTFEERVNLQDGTRIRSVYTGFREDIFKSNGDIDDDNQNNLISWLDFKEQTSLFDIEMSGCQAQLATSSGIPKREWVEVNTTLADINTSELHYIRPPSNLIVIDFDIKDLSGEKSYERNIQAANEWPPTYAELSKSGAGLHLHYYYDGDVTELKNVYSDNIEIKVFTGKSALRRKLTKCNDVPIASINSGLPKKEGGNILNSDVVKTEKGLRRTIEKCLLKEVHPNTKPNMDFIYKILEDAYNEGLVYDVSDMSNDIIAFASSSTNNAKYCLDLFQKMHLKSDIESVPEQTKSILTEGVDDTSPIVFFDIEVFPNLFLVCWKYQGKNNPVVRMINPRPDDISDLLRFRLVGFNNRRYDNHMLYGCMLGYNNQELYELSQNLISHDKAKNYFFREAYNLSYTDIYDFASAKNRKSLKKLEIEMGITHMELGLPWDKPVPKSLWGKVAEYCDNDVIATEAAFDYLKEDFVARLILADLAGMTPNDTTTTLTSKIIFGDNRTPQNEFNYRFMGDLPAENIYSVVFNEDGTSEMKDYEEGDYTVFSYTEDGRMPLPWFPGYKYENGISTYRGEEVGEGGEVYAEPGIYVNALVLDVESMHPSSAIAEELFGALYTKRFSDLKKARLLIKHNDIDGLADILDGILIPYIDAIKSGKISAKGLSNALKTVINRIYGLTHATFESAFRDNRNVDNIVAKRGALFMINLRHEVQKRGFTVIHIKTDSIKIPNPTPEIIQFVKEYGKLYGYNFEEEATYERMCLVNDAVYIAREKNPDGSPGKWTATGEEFAIPYTFKTLFTKEEVTFSDLCETFSLSRGGDLYLDTNEKLSDVSEYEKVKELRKAYEKEEKISKKNMELLEETSNISEEQLDELIAKGHDYHFIGKVGQFVPIQQGRGGGYLYRYVNGKYYFASGAKGRKWLEAGYVKDSEFEKYIDYDYHEERALKSKEKIESFLENSDFIDFEEFVSDKTIVPDFMKIPDGYPDGMPFN